ncbi:MAG TPA: TIM barrel protein, partial [Ilumatobacteraceae bacterium]|nr:TIM barrel protein [Ilumatobacteraceae bacterium]
MTVKMAFNPLPWYVEAGFRPDRRPPYAELLTRIKAAGYDAVPADVPAGSTAAQFAELLANAGMRPAPGYFETALSDVDQRDEAVARAARAAADHASLGLDRIFLADRFGGAAPRFATPGRGIEADPARLAVIIESVAAIARAMTAEGVVPCLHPHVGTWIETADEGSAVLDALPADL